MILGIGIDIVEIKRFAQWHQYAPHSLRRIFSDNEINYCMKNSVLSAQRFAARFAAKEALLKALSAAGCTTPFLTLARAASVTHHPQSSAPYFIYENECASNLFMQSKKIHLSLSHSKEYAIAQVIIENQR